MTIEILAPFTDEQKQRAEIARAVVEELLTAIKDKQEGLENHFVHLGARLYEIQQNQFWMIWGHKSFGCYLKSLEPLVRRGRSQLYACLGIARDLLPAVSEADLIQIGVSKAAVLQKMLKSGQSPSPELIAIAKKDTKERLEGEVAEATGLRRDGDKGQWRSFGGAYYTPDEWSEFISAANAAARTDPPLEHAIDRWENADWWVKKEVLWRWFASYLAEVGPALYQAGAR